MPLWKSYRGDSAHRIGMSTLANWLIAASLVIAIGFGLICASVLIEMRRSDRNQAVLATDNLVSAIESDIARNIELYNLSLQAVIDGLKLPEINQVSKPIRQLILFDRSTTARDLGSIAVTDQSGKVTIDSRTTNPTAFDLSSRDYFVAHVQDRNRGLFIGQPTVNARGEYYIGISRRLERADGTFAGVAAGAISLSYFHNLFRKITISPNSNISLFATDGTLLMRAPFDIEVIGKNIKNTAAFQSLQRYLEKTKSGSFEGISGVDGTRRIYSFHQVGNNPLVLAMGTPVDEIYGKWWDKARLIGALVTLLCVSTVLLSKMLARQLIKRSMIERELAILATTDSMTGVANRRRFEVALDRDWKHGVRNQSSIALLMIDADHFKEYNDKHGHLAGDNIIKSIANAISRNIHRSTDLVARYGGEEFTVLLPGTTIEGACEIAEQIRMDVLSKAPPTISVGVAAIIPQVRVAPDELVAAADTALYQAKRNGRNRVERAELTCSVADKTAMVA